MSAKTKNDGVIDVVAIEEEKTRPIVGGVKEPQLMEEGKD